MKFSAKKEICSTNHRAYYITSKSNIEYLTNFKGTSGSVLITKNIIYLLTDARYSEEAKKLALQQNWQNCPLKKQIEIVNTSKDHNTSLSELLKKNAIKQLMFERNDLYYSKYEQLNKLTKKLKTSFLPEMNYIEKLRAVKTSQEIEKITASQKITDQVFKEIKKYLKIEASEKEIAWKIEYIGRNIGAENISFQPLVCFGKNSAVPHHESDSSKLIKGDLILLDFGFKYKSYCSDMTRVLFTKTPSPLQEKVYETVLKAKNNAIKNIKPGISGIKADSFARSIIKKARFDKEFTHSTGHGVGLDIHELPNLSPKSKKRTNIILQKNMVVTVEPGIYLNGKFGIRLEDMIIICYINKTITKSPDTLDQTFLWK